ncbi:uncharacterized protein [Lolium perenne]|uniref:uncharacterized protein isoform X3 n=1 Tax=Lolium perenne TaxID=4522 RepID=UPI0021F55B05|nr:pistil-specific extensin-like protein isoform X3 [Lolium perenne]
MALRRINPTKKPLLHLPRPFSSLSSSNPPFPPPPPPQSDDTDASPPPPPPNSGEPPQRPSSFSDLREQRRAAAESLDNIRRYLEHSRAASRIPGGAPLTLPLFSPPAARNPNADGAKPCAFDFTILSKGLRKIRQQQKQPPKEFPSATSDSIFAKERAGAEAEDPDPPRPTRQAAMSLRREQDLSEVLGGRTGLPESSTAGREATDGEIFMGRTHKQRGPELGDKTLPESSK